MARAKPVVAIDGPAGAGKSTVASLVARALGYTLVDTGSLYRASALLCRDAGVDYTDREGCERVTRDAVAAGELRLEVGLPGASGAVTTRVMVKGEDPAERIRSPEMSMGASAVSAYPGVREALLDAQRAFGADGGVVLEGRDIGTVVFPDAEVKVFLTARAEVRARRRWEELSRRGVSADYERTLAEVVQRDRQDSERPVAPLKAAPDAVTVDSSEDDAATVAQVIVDLARSRA